MRLSVVGEDAELSLGGRVSADIPPRVGDGRVRGQTIFEEQFEQAPGRDVRVSGGHELVPADEVASAALEEGVAEKV